MLKSEFSTDFSTVCLKLRWKVIILLMSDISAKSYRLEILNFHIFNGLNFSTVIKLSGNISKNLTDIPLSTDFSTFLKLQLHNLKQYQHSTGTKKTILTFRTNYKHFIVDRFSAWNCGKTDILTFQHPLLLLLLKTY